jgi:hypothetical protein
MSGRGVAMTNVFKVGTSNPSLHIAYVAIKIALLLQYSARLDAEMSCDKIHARSDQGAGNAARMSFVCWTRSVKTNI